MENPTKYPSGGTEGNGALTRGIEQGETKAHRAIEHASDAARPAVDRIASGAHQAVDKFADAATHAAESLGVKGGQLKDAQARLMKDWGGYVGANPVVSLGVAVAAGFLLSRLISPR
jgi:ElaB/YqjD/DUF883 family membrane-anchored ribosome-binding protein